MKRYLTRTPWLMLSIGLVLGAVAGAVVTARTSTPRLELPTTLLNATATHGSNTMALATGPVAQGVEGLFILDFITGDLTCQVLNPRTGRLGGAYSANVVQDLGVQQGKQPSYIMVTGQASFRVQGGDFQPAECVVYVADSNTGRYVAYWLPWNRQAAATGFPQAAAMQVLGTGLARNLPAD